MTEVFLGVSRRAMARWLPFLVRLAFCVSLWLIVAPLMTSYLYLIWMNRSLASVMERWNWKLLPADTVSGAVLASIILISFLSLMSFADFLRVEWQQQQQQHQQRVDPLDPDGNRRLRRELADAADANRRRQHEVDNALLERFNEERAQREEEERNAEMNEPDNIQPAQQEQRNDEHVEARDNVDDNVDNFNNARDVDNQDDQNPQNDDNDNDDGAQNRRIGGLLRPAARQQAARPPPNRRPPREFDADENMNFDPLPEDDQVVSKVCLACSGRAISFNH